MEEEDVTQQIWFRGEGERDVSLFLKRWTFNDPLGDSVRPTAEDEEGPLWLDDEGQTPGSRAADSTTFEVDTWLVFFPPPPLSPADSGIRPVPQRVPGLSVTAAGDYGRMIPVICTFTDTRVVWYINSSLDIDINIM